jgi:hypothetical protein
VLTADFFGMAHAAANYGMVLLGFGFGSLFSRMLPNIPRYGPVWRGFRPGVLRIACRRRIVLVP